MDNLLLVGLSLLAFVLLNSVIRNTKEKRNVFKDNAYKYSAKDSMMTHTEIEFYWLLNEAVKERYLVFPQVHLSALLDHHIEGQDWKYAFRHINGKSVDYVLCDKFTLVPTYAIELDDFTHDKSDRKQRDKEVERIFKDTKLPLVRFREVKKITNDQIIKRLVDARELIQ